jgi:hypothetical protein
MTVVSFRFTLETDPARQAQLLGQLKGMAGVQAAGHIDAASADPDISRLCFAESTEAHVPAVVEALKQASGVEAVSVEPRRGLA